ncbi:3-ketoacyl-ACP reductase [Acetobacter cibinongensis]|uniref:3-ketoacyl-ACP reductase n=1 Tax=Acetobacter cibinongensis TaxID=146475 RepID=A0A0D6N1J7_9PROT|nr:3-oxoacyl-ACP reductase FabG [Acetobacter cibinongensis]GAN59804.1 oxidoreductase/SDR, 3-ketoacyl-(acyl carrier protein) reductase [Acetobacter cibinongensis]GBQ14856.1 3-ketoacyl-ACP reductase [Acetobacter cibinongensis NRIC 0482]GEL59327.1 3-ketoacyl-ACP reductase [Acetobacter cibinongensis]
MKRALVTGGTSPIGAAICQKLAADGLHVIVHAHGSAERAHALVGSLLEQGHSAEAWISNLADIAATQKNLATVLEAGVPQVIVHNAGTHDDVTMAGMTETQWRDVISVSLDGFYAVVQPLLLPMTRKRWGRIIALSSVTARIGNRGQVNYAAAKAGLEGAVRSLAREVAGRGITVNAVAPGVIESPATAAVMSTEQIAALVPAKRAGHPAEVADLVAFLASGQAGYITGQTIGINGGMA